MHFRDKMDDLKLIEYINGEADDETAAMVETWIMLTEENALSFARFKDFYICNSFPNTPATDAQMSMAFEIMGLGLNPDNN